MGSSKPRSLLNSIQSFIRRVYETLSDKVSHSDGSIIGNPFRVVGDVIYTGAFLGELNDIEESIYEAVIKAGYISKSGAEALVHKAIDAALLVDGKLVDQQHFESALRVALQGLQNSLKEPPGDWSYLIRVAGFDPRSLPYTVGKAHFQVMTRGVLDEIEASIKNDLIKTEIRKTYLGQVGARVVSRAVDGEAAVELAIQEVRKSLDIVNFFVSRKHPPISGVHLPWEAHGSQEQFVGFRKDYGMMMHSRLKGAIVPVDLRAINEIPSFGRASDLLSKDDPNGFERRLISALQWAGRAAIQERSDQAFLFYAISLENLLLGTKRDTELSYRLSIYGAHLFGVDGQSRTDAHERLKNLYKLRSGVVHAGSAPIRETDLVLIQTYAKRAVVSLLMDKSFSNMTSEDDLDDYFKAKVLGS